MPELPKVEEVAAMHWFHLNSIVVTVMPSSNLRVMFAADSWMGVPLPPS